VKLKFNPSMVREDGPLGMDELDMLHADAVKMAGGDNLWFEAVDAKTLDALITEMNEMNRWFAKIVKYWDEFTSGGDGKKVLQENGVGIQKSTSEGSDAEEEKAEDDIPAEEEEGGDGGVQEDEAAAEGDDNVVGDEGDETGVPGDEAENPGDLEENVEVTGTEGEEEDVPEGGEGVEENEGVDVEADDAPADEEEAPSDSPKVGRGRFEPGWMPEGGPRRPMYDYDYRSQMKVI